MHQLHCELQSLCSKAFWVELSSEDIVLQTPPKKDLWDLCFWLFAFMKQLRKSPHDLWETLIVTLSEEGNDIIESFTIVWPYINLRIKKSYYAELFSDFFKEKKYFHRDAQNDETIVVDYIWANVGKPLHIGHICTPLQWQTGINLLRKLWYTVLWDSHIWDWWIIFWKLIVWYLSYWDDTKLQENAVEHLFDIYVKISAQAEEESGLEQKFRDAFKLLSSWESESVALWKKFTSASIDSMNILLNRLFVFPDFNIGESFYEWLDLPKLENYPDLTYPMHEIVRELIEKWIATKNDDNSVWVVFSESSKLPSCILQKRDGTHGYLASDLACIKYRIENWNPSRIIYFVDVRQQLHFTQAFEIAKQAWWLQDTQLIHAHNGFISLKDGAMSTRKWRIIKLAALLDEAQARARAIILEKRSDMSEVKLQELSEVIGIWAIKYGYLKKSRELDSVFDWDEYMNFDGNSGPYIQYAYVRAKKIISWYTSVSFISDKLHFSEDIETQFIQKLLDFPELISEVEKNYSFHQLCLYAYELTKIFSSFYAELSVLNAQDEVVKYSRVQLVSCFTEIIEEIFSILAIPLPNEM